MRVIFFGIFVFMIPISIPMTISSFMSSETSCIVAVLW